MSRNLVRFLLFVAVCLNTTSIQAASDPEPSDEPRSLPKLPFEGEPPSGVVRENPEELHPANRSGRTAAAAATVVSFLEAVELTAQSPALPYIRSHIQGEFLQEQLIDPLSQQDFPLAEEPQPESGPPEAEGPVQPLAPGDFVAEFDGLANTGWIPPDTVMAVGPSHVVEAVNSGFAVYNKSGGLLQGYTTFASFFAPVLPAGWDGFLFDPRVIYSAEHSRFAMLALGRDSTNQNSFFFLAFPQTSDPTGVWWIYRFDHQSVPTADSDSWADYCGLGADTWGVYVTCNVFRWVGGFKYAKLWSLDTDGFTGGTINGWVFWDLRWNSSALASSLQPALPHTIAGDQATFFVNTWSSSGSSALLWKLTGSRINSPTLTRATITTPTYNAIGENVDQPGTTADLDGGDARVMNAVYSSRRVFTVLTDDVDNNGARAGWLTLKLDVDTNSLSWSHLLFSAAGFYYFYPAVTMEGAVGGANGNLAVFGSWTDSETSVTGSTNFASALFKIYTNQPTNSDGPFINYHNGLAAYEVRDSNGRNRWGDYSGAGFDWSSGNVWGAAEYAGSGNTWRTRITGRKIAGGGCTVDGFEPDDTSGQANSISTNGTPQTHNICPAGDEDWVSFTISTESEVVVETSGPAGDTRMWLYDSGLSQIEFNDDGGSGLFSLIDRTCGVDALPAGTYFVQVDEFGGNDEIATYNLAVTATDCCIDDLVLANDTITGTQTFEAGNSVTLGPSLVVNGTSIEVRAGVVITFVNGTGIGGSFSAGIDPGLACP